MSSGAASSVVLAGALLFAACPAIPPAATFSVKGTLERDGVDSTSLANVAVDYTSKDSRGEWWNCELRMTAGACVGDHHVNAWIAMPGTATFNDLGQTGCIDADGNAFGAFELLTDKAKHGEPINVPADVSVLMLVASDANDSGGANLADDSETTAASALQTGTVEVLGLGSFDAPVALTITGTTTGGNDVQVEMNGPTTPAPQAPRLDKASSCVPSDLVQ